MSQIGSKFLTEAEARMEELKPAVQEYGELEVEVARFKGERPNSDGTNPGPQAAPSTPRRGRRSSNGAGRADEAMGLIEKAGAEGISIPEMAKEMGLANSNYLYRVTATLLEDKKVKKQGQRFIAA